MGSIVSSLSCLSASSMAYGLRGELPGALKAQRRANALFEHLRAARRINGQALYEAMEYVNVYAIAVNEQNAAGGRALTAPTNGAAGVIPAVLKYYRDHCPNSSQLGICDFFLVATAIGSLCKMNASISGAEVGCQGEVGVACSVAAAGLTAALGGTNEQIENRRRDWHRAPSWYDLRSDRRACANPLYRTQRVWRGESHQCGLAGFAQRWLASGDARSSYRDNASNRARYAV